MKTLIIFLDLDGVLIIPDLSNYTEKLNAEGVDLINKLSEEYNVKIVFTTTWRINRSAGDLRLLLSRQYEAKFSRAIKFFDCTEHLPQDTRGDEIRLWLRKYYDYSEGDAYIVIDDNWVTTMNFIKTNERLGLQMSQYEEIKSTIEKQLAN